MNKYKKHFFLFVFFFSLILSIYSSNPLIRNISKKVYKAGNKNWAIKEDEREFLYIANDFGLLVFDGIDWELHPLPNRQAVKSIYVKNHNVIYTGNFEDFGVWIRDANGALQYHSLADELYKNELSNNEFWQVYEKDNRIYFQSFLSIYVVDSTGVSKLEEGEAYLFLMKMKNELWVQKMKGALYRIEGIELSIIPNTDVFIGKDVRAILPLENGNVLIGTSNHGLYIYDGNITTRWDSPASKIVERDEFNCMLSLPNGNILIGTIRNGIHEVTSNGIVVSSCSTENQLQNNTVLSLYKANNGSVWVGMDRGISNVQYLSNLSYYSFDPYDIGAIYDAKLWNNHLFICTNQGVYSILQESMTQNRALTEIKLVDGTQGQAWSLSIIDGKLYCSHNRGVKEVISPLKAIDAGLNYNGAYSIEKDFLHGEEVWLISTYIGLQIVNSHGKLIAQSNGENPVKHVLIDHLDNIWMKIPHKGIHKYRLNKDFQLVEDSLLFENNWGISPSHNLNMFKLGGRVVISKDKSFYTYDEISGQLFENKVLNDNLKLEETIENVKKIKDRYYWVVTASSVHLLYYSGYEVKCLDECALGTYDLSLVDKYENVSVLNDSLSLICLDNGFLIHNRKRARKKRLIKPPSIEFVRGKKNNEAESIYFPIINNSVRITSEESNLLEVSIHNVQAFYNNEYVQYKLTKIEDEWSKPFQTNVLPFSRLPQGEYELYIRSVGRLGETSEANKITLHIAPPFYKSSLAILLYVLLSMLLAYLIWMYILKRHRTIHLQKIRARERLRLKQLNSKLEDEILKVNSELFTRSNLILQKNKLFRELKEVLDSFYKKKNIKDIDQLYRSLSKVLNTDMEDEDNWEMILVSFEQKHPNFYNNLKKVTSDLTPNDLRLCVCLRLNFSSKEISEIMNLSARTVDNNRSRLRKKLNLPPEVNLIDFLLSL